MSLVEGILTPFPQKAFHLVAATAIHGRAGGVVLTFGGGGGDDVWETRREHSGVFAETHEVGWELRGSSSPYLHVAAGARKL